jgi:hypothetical protein
MSWDTTAKTGLILTDLTPDVWTLKEAIPERTETGPDNLRLIYDGFFPEALRAASPSISDYDRGSIPSGVETGTWRITSAVPSRLYGPLWRLEVMAKGAIGEQQKKIRWITGSGSFSAEEISVPGYGLVNQVESRMPEVGMEVGYLAFAATPSTPAVNVAATPPNPRPPTPTNPWSSIDEEIAVIHYPNGWVREAVDADQIVPGLWWITETYRYVFAITG